MTKKKSPAEGKARKLSKKELKKVKGGEECAEIHNSITAWSPEEGWHTQHGVIYDCAAPTDNRE